jgi:hypothetical protein
VEAANPGDSIKVTYERNRFLHFSARERQNLKFEPYLDYKRLSD